MDFGASSLPIKQNIQVASISLNLTDRIRLIGVPTSIIPELSQAIKEGWRGEHSIQDETIYHGAHEFKLRGNPWSGFGDEAVMSRRVINSVLLTMARYGWHLVQSSDVSKKKGDKDTMFFESGEYDPDVQIFAVSFNLTDRIRLVDIKAESYLVELARKAIETSWPRGIQNEKDYNGAFEFKLVGTPFWPDGAETVQTRILLNQLLANLRSAGFKLYGSIDISTGSEGQDLESWFFRKVGPTWPSHN